jgi:16S rRNA (cytosine967-C5)-methyltransferase
VIALEKQGARVNRLARNLSASRRREEVLVVRADVKHPPLPRGRFSSVLLDAPCSGTGTLRKNPEIRTRLTPEKLAVFAAIQRDLLRSALELVAEGGTLTWITCSLEPEENEDVVEAVISERSDMELISPKGLSLPRPLADRVDERGWARILPGRDHDGFSAVTLRRLRQGIR